MILVALRILENFVHLKIALLLASDSNNNGSKASVLTVNAVSAAQDKATNLCV